MRELGPTPEATLPLPLFDAIPPELTAEQAGKLKDVFDGSLDTRGITMVLNPSTGQPLMARFIDLLTGKVISYEPLARGRWTNPGGDLREESKEYQKLERVYEDVKMQYELWKYSPRRESQPIREWTTAIAKNEKNKPPFHPQDWYRKEINPNADFEEASVAKGPRGANYKRHSRHRSGRVEKSAITPSQDGPRMNDARPAPAHLRREADRVLNRELLRERGR